MNWEIFQNSKLVETLGWTLLHSIWQIAVIAFTLFFLLKILRQSSANFRYLLSVCALGFSVILPVVTFFQMSVYPNSSFSQKSVFSVGDKTEIQAFSRRAESFALVSKDNDETPENASTNFSFSNFKDFFGENISRILPAIVVVWFAGMTFFSIRLAGGVRQLRTFKTCGVSAPDEEWIERFSRLSEKLKIEQTVEFLRSSLIETPIVVGWIKPVILVPAGVFLNIKPEQLEIILAHELVHIRRYDNLVNFAQGAIEIFFFYHPGAWWISRIVRREREYACDETVVEIMEGSRLVYAEALANLEEIRLRANSNALPEIAVAANGGSLMKRIEKIIQRNAETQTSSKQSFWSASLALLLISAVVISVFSTQKSLSVNAQAQSANKKIAIGFVSIPPADRTTNEPKDADTTLHLLIEKLTAHKVPAIGFITGASISDGKRFYSVRANLARLWRDSGFEIGIGTFNHDKFYDTTYDEYVAKTEANKQLAKQILDEKNLQLRYFSYPYLNTGRNPDERKRFEAWLETQAITPVKYTFDNQEWMYSYAYDAARNDNDAEKMKRIRAEFLAYMSKMFAHYEQYSQEIFGRDINQTMVLTPNRLVADSADELFGMLEARGYHFVSMDEALKDAAYDTPEDFYGEAGISWFERWQTARGKKLLDEPQVSQEVLKIWENRKAAFPPRAYPVLEPAKDSPPNLIKFSTKN